MRVVERHHQCSICNFILFQKCIFTAVPDNQFSFTPVYAKLHGHCFHKWWQAHSVPRAAFANNSRSCLREETTVYAMSPGKNGREMCRSYGAYQANFSPLCRLPEDLDYTQNRAFHIFLSRNTGSDILGQ